MKTGQKQFEAIIADLILHGEVSEKQFGHRTLLFVRDMQAFKNALQQPQEKNAYVLAILTLNGYILREVCLKTYVFEKHVWQNPPMITDRFHEGNSSVGQYIGIDGEYCMGLASACNSSGEEGIIVRTIEGRIVFIELSEIITNAES